MIKEILLSSNYTFLGKIKVIRFWLLCKRYKIWNEKIKNISDFYCCYLAYSAMGKEKYKKGNINDKRRIMD